MGLPQTGRVVSVKCLGFLRHVVQAGEVGIAVDAEATVGDLLRALADRYGRDFSEAVFRVPGEVHTHVRVFLNEEEARVGDRVAPGGAPAEVAVLVVPGFEGGS